MPDDDDVSVDTRDEVDPEAVKVAQALVAAFAHASSRDGLPQSDDQRGHIPMDNLGEAIEVLAGTTMVSGPVKLELLAQLARAETPVSELRPLAESLVRPALRPDGTATTALLKRVQNSKPGEDPIGRGTLQPPLLSHEFDVDDLIAKLVDGIDDLILAFDSQGCSAEVVEVGRRSTPALSIATTAWIKDSLSNLESVVDPTKWPDCTLQHVFFRSMNGAGPKVALDAPDRGWRQTLREVVDFSFGLGLEIFTTNLDFVYFNESPARIGCTYDLHPPDAATPPGDGQITIDQGYLLAEQFGEWCRVRTLKQVHFAAGNLPSALVCPFWGPATSAIAWACIPSKEQP